MARFLVQLACDTSPALSTILVFLLAFSLQKDITIDELYQSAATKTGRSVHTGSTSSTRDFRKIP